MIAPAGINLEINGRGGDDTLEIGAYAMVTFVNNVGSDGTDLQVTVDSNATLTVPVVETMPAPILLDGTSQYFVNDPSTTDSIFGTSTTSPVAYLSPFPIPPLGDKLTVNWGDGSAPSVYQGANGTAQNVVHSYAPVSNTYLITSSMQNASGGQLFTGPASVVLTVEIQPSVPTLALPAPSQYQYSSAATFAGASLPTDTDTFVPPVNTLGNIGDAPAAAGTPLIDQITQTGQPGDVLAVTAENLSSSTTFWVYGQTNSSNGVFAQAEVVSQTAIDTNDGVETDGAASIVLPPTLPANGVYMVWALNGTQYSPAVVVNQPQITWAATDTVNPNAAEDADPTAFSDTAYTGSTVSLFGTNLAWNNGQTPYDDKSWVYITNSSGSISDWLPVSAVAPNSSGANAVDVNPYKVDFTLPTLAVDTTDSPTSIPAGTYSVYVYNGHGANFGISNAFTLHVVSAPATSFTTLADVYNQNDGFDPGSSYNSSNPNPAIPIFQDEEDTQINPVAVQDALVYLYNVLHNTGGDATLQLPAGTVVIDANSISTPMLPGSNIVPGDYYGGAMWLPPGITLQGSLNSDGSLATTIEAAPGAGLNALINVTGENYAPIDSGLSQLVLDANDGLHTPFVFPTSLGGHFGVVDLGDEDFGTGDQQPVVGFTVDQVTIDGQNQVAMTLGSGGTATTIAANPANVLPDIFGYKVLNLRVQNSTLTGQGVAISNYGIDEIFDNCQFYGCGAAYGQIYGYSVSDISVARCTDAGLINDATSQGDPINPDFDSASRLLCVQNSTGYLYAGDNKTIGLFQVNEAGGLNGGEQLLVESQASYGYQAASYYGVVAFDTSNGVSTVIGLPGNIPIQVGDQIVINSGPGAGETRTVVAMTGTTWNGNFGYESYTLNLPWGVTPSTSSVITFGTFTADMCAFQNTLQGDGMGTSIGTLMGGPNVIEDDNDISNVNSGIKFDSGTTYPAVEPFDIFSNNNIHQTSSGFYLNIIWYGGAVDQPWFIGNAYRQNIISGIPDAGTAGFYFISNAGSETGINTKQVLINVFDSNIITQNRFAIEYGDTTLRNGQPDGIGGYVGNVLWNDFASSDGTAGSEVIYDAVNYSDLDDDPTPFLLEVNDLWYLFETGVQDL